MSDFLKPQSPLQHKDGAYIYPLTTIDQVILEDGNRLNTILDSIDADTLNGKIESELNVANANTLAGYNINNLISKIYPVNSTYISSTNTNPGTFLGGTWELFDKEFTQNITTDAGSFITLNTTNCSAVAGNIVWHNHSLWMNISFTPSVAVTDTTLEMFTFDLSKLGVNKLISGYYSSLSDAGQSVLTYHVSTAGLFTTRDIIVRGSDTGSLATGYTLNVQFEIPVLYGDILDSACNKFYWKRTA